MQDLDTQNQLNNALKELSDKVRPAIAIFVERAESSEKSFFDSLQDTEINTLILQKYPILGVEGIMMLRCRFLHISIESYRHASVLSGFLEDKSEKEKYLSEVSRIEGLITQHCS